MARIAFIGLGNMGRPMAANLVKAQHKVRGFDLSAGHLAAAEQDGVTRAASARDAVKDAEVVITMLPQGAHVLAVWGDIIEAVPAGALMIDCSTIDVDSAHRAHAIAEKAGLESVDAPVSGGTAGAEAATLTIMVGGSPEAFARARPVLEGMAKKVVRCGDPGMGQAAKICNNMMAGINMLAMSEAFALGERLGISAKALFEVTSTSSAQSALLIGSCPVPGVVEKAAVNRGFKPGFAVPMMVKDLRLAQAAAASAHVASPMGALAAHLFRMHELAGNGHLDYSSIIELIRGYGE